MTFPEYTEAELLEASHHRIDCPIDFCIGRAFEHGVDGTDPEQWLHSGPDETLASFAQGNLSQRAGGPLRYSLYLDVEADHTADELAVMVAELRLLATRLEARVETLKGRNS